MTRKAGLLGMGILVVAAPGVLASGGLRRATTVAEGLPMPPVPRVTVAPVRVAEGLPMPPVPPEPLRVAEGLPMPPVPRAEGAAA